MPLGSWIVYACYVCGIGALSAVGRAQSCPLEFSSFGAGQGDYVQVVRVIDLDGDGPSPVEMWVGGRFSQIGGVAANNIAVFKAGQWHPVGSGADGAVEIIEPLDLDGAGPMPTMIVIGGRFESIDGVPASKVAVRDGANWRSACTAGMNRAIYALAAFNDGGGPKLYVGGDAGALHRCSPLGSTWETPWCCDVITDTVYCLQVVDLDGLGRGTPELLVGGRFSGNLASWRGGQMRVLSHPAPVKAIRLLDDGSGLATYLAADNGVYRYDGATFVRLGAGSNSAVQSICTLDIDGPGPAPALLVAGGRFTAFGTQPCAGLSRFVGGAWVAVDATGIAPTAGGVFSIAELPLSADLRALVVGGGFTMAGPVPARNLAKIDGSAYLRPAVFVRRGAPPGGDGRSWATAYSTISEGLASPDLFCLPIPAVWVSRGLYTPAGPGGVRTQSFDLPPGVSIVGGFVGTERELSERPPLPTSMLDATDVQRATILSGDLNGDDLGDINGNDNSYHVVTVPPGTGAATVLDGVTITAGNANAVNGLGDNQGGGLYGVGNSGPGASPTLRNVFFCRNRANHGGAAYFREGNNTPVSFVGCTFQENTAGCNGGAIGMHRGVIVELRECAFVGNRAAGVSDGTAPIIGGGAVSVDFQTTRCIVNAALCEFRRNTSAHRGGAVAMWASPAGDDLRIDNCAFLGNVSVNGGGAVYLNSRTDFRAVNCLFVGNVASNANDAVQGGGAIGNNDSAMRLVNCTLAHNASPAGASGGITAVSDYPVELINCVLWGNSNVGAAFGPEAAQARLAGANRGARYCQWQSVASSVYVDAGCSGGDPLFVRAPSPGPDGVWGTVDDDYGDLRLGVASPGVDSGDASLVLADANDVDGDGNVTELVPLDLTGFPRFVDDPAVEPNPRPGNPPHVDRGAYESQVNCVECPGPREWRAGISGPYDFPGSWTPSVPQAFHNTAFNRSAAYGVAFTAGTLPSVRSATISKGAVSLLLNGATWSLTSTIDPSLAVGDTPGASATVNVSGGTVRVVNGRVGSVAGATGAMNVSGAGTAVVSSRSMCVGCDGAGVMNITGGAAVTTRDAVIGDQPGSSGVVSVSGVGSRWDVPFFLVIDNGSLDVQAGASVNAGFGVYLFNQGRITGTGTINGPVVNFGTIAAGNSPGTLTINGSYEQVGSNTVLGGDAGKIEAQIAGAAPGMYDKVVVNGPATLGGGMEVSLMGGFQPQAGDQFQLVTAQQVLHPFDVIFFPALAGPSSGDKYLRATYSGTRGPGGGVTVNVASLSSTPSFGAPQPYGFGGTPTSATAGDLNNDGRPDLVVTLADPSNPDGADGTAIVLFNRGGVGNGWLGFGAATVQLPTKIAPSAVLIADVDGDGRNDLVIANSGSDSLSAYLQNAANAGTFGAAVVASSGGAKPVDVAAADFDRDTKPDLVVANAGRGATSGNVSAMRNVSTPGVYGTGVPATLPAPPSRMPRGVRPFNPDNDKDLDLAVAFEGTDSSPGEVAVFVNVYAPATSTSSMFTGSSAPAARMAMSAAPTAMEAARLRPGGLPTLKEDLVVVSAEGNSLTVIVNTLSNVAVDAVSFAPPVDYALSAAGAAPAAPTAVVVTDLDRDANANPDLAVLASRTSGGGKEIRLIRNDSTPASATQGEQAALTPLTQATDVSGAAALTLVSADVDADGRPDLVTVSTTPPGPGGRGPATSAATVARNALPPLVSATGACCAGSTCVQSLPGDCLGANRKYTAAGVLCNGAANVQSPCCKADYNKVGNVELLDIFAFLNGWFSGNPMADFSGSSGVDLLDIFAFLNAWFAGACPG